ncbi:hypothetical protein ACHAPT_002880 [Fusarium lateritium]
MLGHDILRPCPSGSRLSDSLERKWKKLRHYDLNTMVVLPADAEKEATKDTVEITVKGPTKSATKDLAKDEAKDTAKDKDVQDRDTSEKDVAKDAAKDAAKDTTTTLEQKWEDVRHYNNRQQASKSAPPSIMAAPPAEAEKDTAKDPTKDEDLQDCDTEEEDEKRLAEWLEAWEEVERIYAQGEDAFNKAFPDLAGAKLAHTTPDVAISLLEEEFGSA